MHQFFKKLVLRTILLLVLGACTQCGDPTAEINQEAAFSTSPEAILKEFVTKSVTAKTKEELRQLASLTTGVSQQALNNLTDFQFENYFKKREHSLVDLTITDIKKVSSLILNIDYRISYIDNTPGTKAVEFSNTKHAILLRLGEEWKIAGIKHAESRALFLEGIEILGRP